MGSTIPIASIYSDTRQFIPEYALNMRDIKQALKEGSMNYIVYNSLSSQIGYELKREVGLLKVMNKVKELEPYYEADVKNKPWLLYDTGYNQLFQSKACQAIMMSGYRYQ